MRDCPPPLSLFADDTMKPKTKRKAAANRQAKADTRLGAAIRGTKHGAGQPHLDIQGIDARPTKRAPKRHARIDNQVLIARGGTAFGRSVLKGLDEVIRAVSNDAAGQMKDANQGPDARRTKQSKAKKLMSPVEPLPSTTNGSNGAESGQSPSGIHTSTAGSAPSIADNFRVIQSRRVAIYRSIRALENTCRSFVRNALDFTIALPPRERARIARMAANLIDHIRTDPESSIGPEALTQVQIIVAPLVSELYTSIDRLTAIAKGWEDDMRVAAAALPAWPWWNAIKGCSALGLAIIVAEAGHDLRDFPTPSALWMRLGLAPPHCYAAITKSGAACNKKPKRRRSAIWTVSDSALRQGNVYQALYRQRRDYELKQHPEFDNGKGGLTKHGDLRARRVAEKELIKDLWRAWRAATATETDRKVA